MGAHQQSQAVVADSSSAHIFQEIPIENKYIEEVIYREQIPDFVAATLIRLYDNVFCTLHRIEAYEGLQGISTYIRRVDSTIQTLILFRHHGTTIRVVNQQLAFETEELNQFAKKIFAEYKRVQTISFYALDTDAVHFEFPFQHLAVLEENIIYFPTGVEDYLTCLKGQFRKQLRISKEQMLAEHPAYEIKVISGAEIQPEHVRAILGLAKARMCQKGKDDYTRQVDVSIVMNMLRKCGHMAIAVIGNEICGGAMWFSVGRRHFHQLAAYNSNYDRYMLGNQIWLAAISYSLRLGGRECWLMGGASMHKARFGAQKKVFSSYVFYRSRLHIFLNLRKCASMWTKDRIRKTKAALKQMSEKPDFLGRCVKKSLLAASLIQAGMHQFLHSD
jgi:hypothetical protein